MANDLNIVAVIGRLTKDPSLKSTNNGGYICNLSLANNRSIYNRQTGESRDKVNFFEVTLWGKTAETASKHLSKGSKICVEGTLEWSSWEGTDGKKQSKVTINASGFQFIDPKQGDSKPESGAFDSGAMNDDSIPF